MKNYYNIMLTVMVTALIGRSTSTEMYHPEPQTGWSYHQSTQQAFYIFEEITIDGDVVVGDGSGEGDGECYTSGTCDVVGAFRRGVCDDPGHQNSQELCEIFSVWNTDEEICVGWRYADSNGWTTVPLMGREGSEGDNTFTYMNPGEIPYLKIYDSSNGSILDLNPGSELPGWEWYATEIIAGTSTACNGGDGSSCGGSINYCLNLHEGANLISFYALPDDVSISHVMSSIEGNATGVIGEGVAANYNGTDWMGSLNTISSLSGYWVIVSEAGSLCIEDGTPTDPAIQYSLHSGANLISFPVEGSVEISSSLPDDIEGFVSGIIGEGVAANNQPPWQGSLSALSGGNGYWMITTEDISFSFDVSTMSRIKFDDEVGLTAPDNKEIHQSTEQAFYFIESIENIEIGDWILAYNGDEVIGARQWQGTIIDIPAMGSDGSDYTKGYMEAGKAPQFKLLQDDKLIDLTGEVPAWSQNQLFMISSLRLLPDVFSLSAAYPNPFNPTTQMSLKLNINADVSVKVFNMTGQLIDVIANGKMDAGSYSFTWDGTNASSGVYFIQTEIGSDIHNQKIMFVK